MTTRPTLLTDLAARYIWWRDEHTPSDDRVVAQVMNFGTYDDIRRLEAAYSPGELRAVMLRAQPGWIGERSWGFWRGRLLVAEAGPIPEAPPGRSFDAEVLEAPHRRRSWKSDRISRRRSTMSRKPQTVVNRSSEPRLNP